MPLPIIPGAFRTISTWSSFVGGRPWSVTMDYVGSGAGDSAQDLGDAIVDAWATLFASTIGGVTYDVFHHNDVSLQEVLVYDLGSLDAPTLSTPTTPIVGDASTALPADVSYVVSKRTGQRGRAGRGRIYMGGLAQGVMDNGNPGLFSQLLTTAVAPAFEANFLGVLGATGEYGMVVISQAAVPDGTAFPITSLTIDVDPDTQRRRGRA